MNKSKTKRTRGLGLRVETRSAENKIKSQSPLLLQKPLEFSKEIDDSIKVLFAARA